MPPRSLIVSRQESGKALVLFLQHKLNLSKKQAAALLQKQQIHLNGNPIVLPQFRVQAGQRYVIQERPRPKKPNKPQPKDSHGIIIRYVDSHIVVVDKPPGLTTMRHPEEAAEFGKRGQRFLPPTVADLLPGLLSIDGKGKKRTVRAVHRLDKETSGLVVFARTVEAERHLGKQFRAHSVERRYLALVRGLAVAQRIESSLIDDRGDGRRGSTKEPAAGKRAVTHVRVIEKLPGYTLVECRLETGRTHQVRIHLGEAGTPLCGERIYDRPLHGKPKTDGSGFRRPALHAASLALIHPATGKSMTWESALPREFRKAIERLNDQSET